MDRRTLLKLLGGIAALPALGKAIKGTGIKAIKAAGKVLPKVQGMPEWFTPLVNKIMKEGVDISPKASRVEDMTTVKKLEIPSETGKPEVITLTENKITGEITIEANVSGGVADSPFELNYRPPKSDINLETGKEIKYPGDFQVIENRPRPTREPGDYEFDYDNFDINDAYSDVEKLEKIATGKIKDVKKIEQRAKGREMINQSPYEDIMNRYSDPIELDDVDFADGGLASFINGGKVKKKKISKDEPEDEYGDPQTGEKRIPLMQGIRRGYDFENTMPNIYNSPRLSQVDLADGGVASMFRERPGYQEGGFTDYLSNPLYQSFLQSPFYQPGPSAQVITPITLPSGQILNLPNAGVADQFKRYLDITPQQRPDDLGLPGQENLREETLEEAMNRGEKFFDPIGGFQVNPLTGGRMGTGIDPNFITQRAMQAEQDAAARTKPYVSSNQMYMPGVTRSTVISSPYQTMKQDLLMRQGTVQTGGTPRSASEGSSGINPLFAINRLIQAEQDAAARVAPRMTMAYGGLTNTVPPAMGPDSQGVESLFRRRYN